MAFSMAALTACGSSEKDSEIGSSTRCLPAGIYYLSQNENSLGQLQTDGGIKADRRN